MYMENLPSEVDPRMAHEYLLKMATSHVHVRTVALLGLPETGREPFDASAS